MSKDLQTISEKLYSGNCLFPTYCFGNTVTQNGAVEPLTEESGFLVVSYINTLCVNLFPIQLSKRYPDDMILVCCDGAVWHKVDTFCIP